MQSSTMKPCKYHPYMVMSMMSLTIIRYQNSVYDLAAVQKSFNHELSLLYRVSDVVWPVYGVGSISVISYENSVKWPSLV